MPPNTFFWNKSFNELKTKTRHAASRSCFSRMWLDPVQFFKQWPEIVKNHLKFERKHCAGYTIVCFFSTIFAVFSTPHQHFSNPLPPGPQLFSTPPQFFSTCPILSLSEHVLYSAVTYTLSGCINITCYRPIPAHPSTHPALPPTPTLPHPARHPTPQEPCDPPSSGAPAGAGAAVGEWLLPATPGGAAASPEIWGRRPLGAGAWGPASILRGINLKHDGGGPPLDGRLRRDSSSPDQLDCCCTGALVEPLGRPALPIRSSPEAR